VKPRAPVLAFHDIVPVERIGDVPVEHRPYALPPPVFRSFLLAASTSPRRSLPVGDVPGELGGLFYSLTFDDGHESDYTEAFPVLCELGLRATFFVVPTLVETPGYVTWSQLREMVTAGMEIGSHSLTHPFMDKLGPSELEREWGESKAMIEGRLGSAVRSASLPRGWPPRTLEPTLRRLGYRVFCTSRVGWWHPGDAPLSMPRVPVRRGLGLEDFAAIINAERRALWRLQLIDSSKNVVKRFLGRRGWAWLRKPLLSVRYSFEP
jgi:peptidoglycan/xylan/chitin deacetylase (PgdA/CDA1 family)